jgi:hypothetical protein
MTTNTILSDAEQRIPPTVTTAQTIRQERLAAMREEIGPHHFTQAKEQLPELERLITKTYRPFLDRMKQIQAQTKAPLRSDVLGWLQEMGTLCEIPPHAVRKGIEGWTQLTVPLQPDGKSLDLMTRSQLMDGIRRLLKNWEGTASRLEILKAQVEQYILDSNWPASSPTTETPQTAA